MKGFMRWCLCAIASSVLVGSLGVAAANASVAHRMPPAHSSAPEVHLPAATCNVCFAPTAGSFSGNWSGYVQNGSGYNSISATWTVPSVASSGSTSSDSSTWVGIDGSTNSDLIQAGTEQGWNPGTQTAYYDAWWEILPASETVMFSVSPGDNIVVSIQKLNATQWSIFLLDHNNGESFLKTVTYTGPQTSAEFIQEAPTFGTTVGQLAGYTPVAFYNARVNGASPSLAAGQEVTMLQGGAAVSTPSAPNQAANGFAAAYGAGVPAAPPTPLFQRHSDGSVWAATGAACSGASCPGWYALDNNALDAQVAAGAGSVFERHTNGSVWEWTGGPCTSWCPGWVELDDNPATTSIVAGSGSVYELHSDGSIWRSTGAPCVGQSCPGWIELDANPAAVAIAAGAGTVYQLHSDGSVWRSTGVACSGGGCPGWTELDDHPTVTAIAASAGTVYELRSNGSIWESTGVACSGSSCPGWIKLDDNPAAVKIAAGGNTVYELRSNGAILRSTGAACSGSACHGWVKLDDNPAATAITASAGTVYELHSNGTIWQSTGVACTGSSCPGWTELDNNPRGVAITVSNGS